MKNIVILYHAECSDGFGGAWSAWKKFKNKADYIGVKHGTAPPEGLKDKEIYFIDFIYPEETTKELIKNNKRVVAIDHHISAKKLVEMTQDYSYAIDHSGSVLAWRYFNPKRPIPRILKYIEDMDLWKFKIPYTMEILAWLNLSDFNFKIWDKLSGVLEKAAGRKRVIRQGKMVVGYEDKIIDKLILGAEEVEFAGYETSAVNSPIFSSQIGMKLTKIKPPIGIIWYQRNGKKVFSLRSNGKADVSVIAARFGGGGHKTASGFALDADQSFPWKAIRKH